MTVCCEITFSCTSAPNENKVELKKENSESSEKGEREPYIEWLWKENWTSLINTALMFSHTLLLPKIVNDKEPAGSRTAVKE